MEHRRRKSLRGALVLAVSLALHGGLLSALSGRAHATTARVEPVRVRIQSVPPPPQAPVSEPVREHQDLVAQTPTEPAKRARDKRSPTKVASVAPKQVSAPIEAAEPAAEVVDFTGITLTNPLGTGGFSAVVGNGEVMTGPLGATPRGARTGSGPQQAQGTGTALNVVALGKLSRPPRAPDLDEALVANYPRSARDSGQPGMSVVRVRIFPDGRVGQTDVLVASAPEFGRACQRTLAGSRWSAPLDEKGRPVATDVSYTCEFEVTR